MSKERRNLIKGLGIGLPTAWVAPVIQSVVLPAHAATTVGATSACSGGDVAFFGDEVVPSSITPILGGPSVPYTATTNNSSGTPLTGVGIQAYVEQQMGAVSRAAGGTEVNCVGDGIHPVGQCVTNFTYNASNSAAGVGTLVPGQAQLRIELRCDSSSTPLDEWSTFITILSNS